MSRRKQPPRLWLRPASRRSTGAIRPATWVILDDGKHIATGCAESETERAQQALAGYIAQKYKPAKKRRAIEIINVADVLSIYLDARLPALRDRHGVTDDDEAVEIRRFKARIGRLNEFWGGKMLSEVNGDTCRDYGQGRTNGGARRDLEDLSAAIGHHLKEGYHREIVLVTLPEKGVARDRWLTRSEAAALIWACWRKRELQVRHRGVDKGRMLETDKRPLQHLARFILIGLKMGNRAGAIASASPYKADGRSFVDLERGVYYRLAQGKKQTNKRQPPAPIPPTMLAHMRRWVRKGIAKDYFVEWQGKPVKSVKTGFGTAVMLAGIEHASPHTLRHTAATWLMQNGAPIWQAAGYLGMSEKTLRDNYGHHHPDFMSEAVAAVERRPQKPQSLVVSLANAREQRSKPSQDIEIIGGPGRTRTCNQTVMSAKGAPKKQVKPIKIETER
jgi:integrase